MEKIIDRFGTGGCFFIAEIGNNHQGKLDYAKEMVLSAKRAGASAVKFQKRNNRNLMQSNMAGTLYENRNSFGKNYLDHREAVELSIQDFKELKVLCETNEILFFATPFDEESLEELASLDCELFKVASADIVHNELLKKIAVKGKPVILSTGGATIEEVDNAVELIQSYNVPLSLLQCTAAYPCDISDMNLNVIKSFQARYKNVTLGISDHQSGISMALIAYMQGARVFEKHFTLHRSWKGTDQAFSLEPEGFRKMVRDITSIEAALGSGEKMPLPVEKDAIFKMRKSLVLKVSKSEGEAVLRNDLEFKCPGNGIAVNKMGSIIGRKLNRSLLAGTVLSKDDFYA
jgi:sialic acid synthase